MTVHVFGVMVSPYCANFALKSNGRDNFIEFSPTNVETIWKLFYANYQLKSMAKKEEVMNLVRELIEAMKKGGFSCDKFLSNDQCVLMSILESETTKPIRETFFLGSVTETNALHLLEYS